MASTRHLVIAIIGITLVLVGIALVGFPFASQSLNAKAQTRIGAEYTLIANHESAQRFEQAVAANEAGDYKAALAQLTLNGTDAIARVRIPSLEIDLPIYPSANDNALARGAGWLPGSALPVGGSRTHSVVTAHSGMPTHRMFDRLPKLKRNDLIHIDVLGRTLTYKVVSTTVDTPEAGTRHLQPHSGKDQLTLITCTPYGVNTHRLLVTGIRTDVSPPNIGPEALGQEPAKSVFHTLNIWVLAISIVCTGTVAALALLRRKRRRVRSIQKQLGT